MKTAQNPNLLMNLINHMVESFRESTRCAKQGHVAARTTFQLSTCAQLKLLVMTAFFGLTISVRASAAPNVVLILTDDQRSDPFGYHPIPLLDIKTPNIDKLATARPNTH